MTPLDREGFVSKWGPVIASLHQKERSQAVFATDLDALLDAARAAERERFKCVFIWRDGQPYYDTANQIPMEISKRVKRKIMRAIRKED